MAKRRCSFKPLLLVALLGLQGCASNGLKTNNGANEALLQAVGNHSALVSLYRDRLAQATDPEEADDNRLKLARAYLASGGTESALFYCEPVIVAGRNPVDCLLVKFRVLLSGGKHEDALTAAQSALALRRDDAEILNQLGLVHADAGNYDTARTKFNRSRELMLDDVTARNNLAMVDILEQRWDQAADRLMPLFRSGQADDKVTANLLLALARSQRFQEFTAVCGREGEVCQQYYDALSTTVWRDGDDEL